MENRRLICLFLSGIAAIGSVLAAGVSPDSPPALYQAVPSDFIFPLDVPPLLSANFGELRENHFHTGLDFKTQGVEGKWVRSVADGWVSRISIKRGGYGKALYISHPNGTTTVYGHLRDLSPRLDSVLKAAQYRDHSYFEELTFESGLLPVRQGEVVAYSGNTGGSAGPHLHFEVRDTESEDPLDPLLWYSARIADKTAPRIRSMALYACPGEGVLSSGADCHVFDKPSSLPKVWGKIALGVSANDYMDGTSNYYGICRVRLLVDSHEVFCQEINRLPFDQSRYINLMTDYSLHYQKNIWMIRMYREACNPLEIYSHLENDGWLVIDEERPYEVCCELTDRHGNATQWTFRLQGARMEAQTPKDTLPVLYPDMANDCVFRDAGFSIPKNALYYPVRLNYTQRTCDSVSPNPYYSDCYGLLDSWIPLHTPMKARVRIQRDCLKDKSDYYLARRSKSGQWTYVGGEYEVEEDGSETGQPTSQAYLTAELSSTGEYVVMADSIAPKIIIPNIDKESKNSFLRIKVSDDASGVASYEVFVDGQWTLFEDDYKKGSVFGMISLDPDVPEQQKHSIKVRAWDNCQNMAEKTIFF